MMSMDLERNLYWREKEKRPLSVSLSVSFSMCICERIYRPMTLKLPSPAQISPELHLLLEITPRCSTGIYKTQKNKSKWTKIRWNRIRGKKPRKLLIRLVQTRQ